MGIAGIIDRAFLRDHQGVPYLSGASIKGRLRYATMRILSAPTPAGTAPWSGCAPWRRPARYCRGGCLFCVLYGSPLFPAALSFADAYPDDEARLFISRLIGQTPSIALASPAGVRTVTAVDRARRTVQPHHLYSTETMPSGLEFHSRIIGDLAPDPATLLRQACYCLDTFGSGSSRGLGFCSWSLREDA